MLKRETELGKEEREKGKRVTNDEVETEITTKAMVIMSVVLRKITGKLLYLLKNEFHLILRVFTYVCLSSFFLFYGQYI